MTKLNSGIIKTFKRDIDERNWSLVKGNRDVNLRFEMFLRLLGKIIDKYAPLKKTSRRKTKRKNQTLDHKGNRTINEN